MNEVDRRTYQSTLWRGLAVFVAALALAVSGCDPDIDMDYTDAGEGNPEEGQASPGELDEEATEGETARVSDITLGSSIGGAKQITRPTQEFQTDDTVFVSISMSGYADDAWLIGRWYRDDEQVATTRRRISPAERGGPNGNPEITAMQIGEDPGPLEPGEYTVEIVFNDTVVEAVPFEVLAEGEEGQEEEGQEEEN